MIRLTLLIETNLVGQTLDKVLAFN